ncbi:glycosyl hydrolase [Aureimonas fodinaquatilis]|uniref:Glycosyl hydrolase n=1 Tax=Aureimonas fodinaquatilis TaxID=2565783 RepID=A0A5B0DZC8_9HYPH|nr:glycoside hydrolase family 88 protein [Aureimonas fodinaquatilis]KAA0971893.1 glycosyl hydrolase [Aureimonas fodinaquatilis]
MNSGYITQALDLISEKTLEDEFSIGSSFPYVTAPSGEWTLMPASLSAGYSKDGWSHGNWFSGFWIGLLVAGSVHKGDKSLINLARERFQMVAPRATDGNTHDIGFLFWSSAVPLYNATGESRFADVAVQAANHLRARLVTTHNGAYISSWGPLTDPRGRCSSAIDTMANLSLLYWAANYAGDASFRLAAEAHARMTRTSFIRPDNSTYHAVEYDLPSGKRSRGYTFQGYSDESAWTRGQGWAIYGYAETAAATGKIEYLELAEQLAAYYLNRLGNDPVPFWDFDDPAIPHAPRDSATAAIVAAAFLNMADMHPDREKAAYWKGEAEKMLAALCAGYLATEPQHRGILKHGCYSKPHNIGPDSAVLFGDYYFAEALMRLKAPGKFHNAWGTSALAG